MIPAFTEFVSCKMAGGEISRAGRWIFGGERL